VVVGAELFEGPVGNVLAAVGAVFGVGVEGEALGTAGWKQIRYQVVSISRWVLELISEVEKLYSQLSRVVSAPRL